MPASWLPVLSSKHGCMDQLTTCDNSKNPHTQNGESNTCWKKFPRKILTMKSQLYKALFSLS
jgi:hypothetical protein